MRLLLSLLVLLACSNAFANNQHCQHIASSLPSSPEVVFTGDLDTDNPQATLTYVRALMRHYYDATFMLTNFMPGFHISRYEASYAVFVVAIQTTPPFVWCVLANPYTDA